MSSGPTKTKAARREAGRVRIEVWLSREAAEALDALAEREGTSRREAVERLLRASELSELVYADILTIEQAKRLLNHFATQLGKRPR